MKSVSENTIVQTSPLDNVGIVCHAFGVRKGAVVLEHIVVAQDIPMGHKVALQDIHEGEEIVRYGQVIGYANAGIYTGEWVDERKMNLPQPPDLESIPLIINPLGDSKEVQAEPLDGFTFEGYRNVDGSVGTKNVLGITTSVQCVAGITNYISNAINCSISSFAGEFSIAITVKIVHHKLRIMCSFTDIFTQIYFPQQFPTLLISLKKGNA